MCETTNVIIEITIKHSNKDVYKISLFLLCFWVLLRLVRTSIANLKLRVHDNIFCAIVKKIVGRD